MELLYNDLALQYREGKLGSCSTTADQKKLEEIFDSNVGARYVGEFAIEIIVGEVADVTLSRLSSSGMKPDSLPGFFRGSGG